MANYIAQVLTPRVSTEHIASVKIPEGGLHAGQVVVLDTVDTTDTRNFEVYAGTKPTTALLGSGRIGIILSGGFETLADGRRPAGQPNYYKHSYNEDEVAPVVFLDRHLRFNIGADVLDPSTASTADVGKFLYAVNGSNNLVVGSSVPEGTTQALKILKKYNTPIGGLAFDTNNGFGFASSFVCVAI